MGKMSTKMSINQIIEYMKKESELAKVYDISGVSNVVKKVLYGLTNASGNRLYRNTTYFNQLKKMVFNSNSIDHIIALASADIKTLDRNEIVQFVKKSGNPYWAYKYVKAFPNIAPSKRREFEEIILKSRDPKTITRYCIVSKLDSQQFRRFQDTLCGITDNVDARKYLPYFFKHVASANSVTVGKAYINTFFSADLPINYGYPAYSEAEIRRSIDKLFDEKDVLQIDGTPCNVYVNQSPVYDRMVSKRLHQHLDDCIRHSELNKIKRKHKDITIVK